MKLILLATILAFVTAGTGTITSIEVSAQFYNTTNKPDDALCQLTVSSTITSTATSTTPIY